MRIPEVRKIIYEKAAKYNDGELLAAANALYRRSAGKRVMKASRPMTPELATAIRAYKEADPGVPQAKIAEVFNVNPGRVSESLNGKRI
jgi:hypothetical protein